MRLTLVNYEYPPLGGGGGKATLQVARALAAARQEVTVLTSAWGGLPARETDHGVVVRRVRCLRARKDRAGLAHMGAFAGAAALELLRGPRPDAVLAFFALPGGPAALALRRLAGVPYVLSLRGGDVPGHQADTRRMHAVLAPLTRAVLRGAAAVTAVGPGLARLAEDFSPGLSVRVVRNGVDAGRFAPGGAASAGGPVRLLYAGRLRREKGLAHLLRSLAGLRGGDWILELAGDGPQRGELDAMAAALGLTAQVRFTGWRDWDDMPAAYAGADVFVLPSPAEGASNVVLEAMAAGLPVAALDVPGVAEAVIHGETGLLAAPWDEGTLARNLGALVADPALRAALGAAGRERTIKHFGWEAPAGQYLKLCREAAQPGAPGAAVAHGATRGTR